MYNIPCPKFGSCFFPDVASLMNESNASPKCLFDVSCVDLLTTLPDDISPDQLILILEAVLLNP